MAAAANDAFLLGSPRKTRVVLISSISSARANKSLNLHNTEHAHVYDDKQMDSSKTLLNNDESCNTLFG